MHFIAKVLLVCPLLAFGQKSDTGRPSFKEYPVTAIYDGRPASPVLSRQQRDYRTVIRRGAKATVQFAGHYTVPQFGCGSGCSVFYIVDSITGKVYDGFSISELPLAWIEQQSKPEQFRIEFHPSSRLLQINACPNEKDCGYYDYLMVDGKGLELIRKSLLPSRFQY